MGRGRPRDGSPALRGGFRGARVQQRSAAGTRSGALTLLTGHTDPPRPVGADSERSLTLDPWAPGPDAMGGCAGSRRRLSDSEGECDGPALERLPLARGPPDSSERARPGGHPRVGSPYPCAGRRSCLLPALAGEATAQEPRDPRPPPPARQGAPWKNAMGFW